MSINPDLNLTPQVTEPQQFLGTVLAVQANYYHVQFAPVEPGQTPLPSERLLCTRRSRLKKIGQQVMVGDRVVVEEPDWVGGRGAIAQVLPRSSELDRPPIANADQILLVFAMAEPMLDAWQLSRFLVKAESTGIAVCLCLNKSDLVSTEMQADWRDRLGQWGYEVVFLSVQTQVGLMELSARLQHRTTIVSGPSGVGKSSLINDLIPAVNLRVGAVSGKLARGRHTTRHAELFELPKGGLLADTPGFNQPDLACHPLELSLFFPEIQQRLSTEQCQFSDCLHRDEPNCVVRGDWERYEHYLRFLDEAIAYQTELGHQPDEDAAFKTKIGGDGQAQTEPRLASKKYRRPSRRTEKKALRDLCLDLDMDNLATDRE